MTLFNYIRQAADFFLSLELEIYGLQIIQFDRNNQIVVPVVPIRVKLLIFTGLKSSVGNQEMMNSDDPSPNNIQLTDIALFHYVTGG